MERSTSIVSLAKSIMRLQEMVGKIIKDAKNPFHNSKYATLSHILDSLEVPSRECGISYIQIPDGQNGLTTIITHLESGEYIQATYNMNPSKSDPQALGSAITYARRYALSSMLGLNIDDDDDGNAASGKNTDNGKQKGNHNNNAPAKPWLNPNTDQWRSAVKYLVDGGLITDIEKKYQLSKTNREKLISEASQ